MSNLLAANAFQDELLRILAIIFMFVGAVIGFWAMYLGFKMASASDEGKRKEAKKRLINSIVSMVLIIILAGMLFGINFMTGPGNDNDDDSIMLNSMVVPDDQEWRPLLILSGGGLSQATYDITSASPTVVQVRQSGAAASGWEVRGMAVGTVNLNLNRRFTSINATIEIAVISYAEWQPPVVSPDNPEMGPGTPTHADAIFSWPLTTRSSNNYNHFGLHRNRNNATGAGHHLGIDLMSRGSPFFAIADGVVTWVGANGYGIQIRHQGPFVINIDGVPTTFQALYSFYFHNAGAAVSQWQEVSRGQRIGTVGSHLHIEISTLRSATSSQLPTFVSGRTTRNLEITSNRLHPLRVLGGTIPARIPA